MSLAVHNAISQAGSSLRNAAVKTQGTDNNNDKELGKQDFLNLMMTQMANQDPMDPMDSEKMMTQMAALGTVEQLQNVNKQLDTMVSGQHDIARASAFSYIDKDVEVGSNSLKLAGGKPAPASYSLDGNAERVQIHILTPEGDPVRVIKKEGLNQGSHSFNWDGTDNEGDMLPQGEYKYKVFASTGDGEKIGVNQFKKGRVSSVNFESGRPTLVVNGEDIPLHQIKGVNTETEKRFEHTTPLPIKTKVLPKGPILNPNPLAMNQTMGK